MITLDRTPICPLCADALVPGDISTCYGIAMDQLCATRAKVILWPEPYDLAHLFKGPDLELQCGIWWYHPKDNRPETAIARRVRLDIEFEHEEIVFAQGLTHADPREDM